eukprot:snap_masked-scaffold_1-processed-gene-10.12-mRNA-1 protein AED:1.00 eAED:1.00 QI:0/-1/0/0/-1/1/1/0/512
MNSIVTADPTTTKKAEVQKEIELVELSRDGAGEDFSETYIVYKTRWGMLALYCCSIIVNSFQAGRFAPLAQEFAEYFNTTNEVNLPDDLGVDFLTVSSSFFSIGLYPIAGFLVSKFGLYMMSLGSALLAVSGWWYYFSPPIISFYVVGKVFASAGSALVQSSLLRLAGHWFAPSQRATAIAIGGVFLPIGGAMIFVTAPMFKTGEELINLDLKSCKSDFSDSFNFSEAEIDIDTGEALCNELAEEKFCCYSPTDIDGLNLVCAVLTSVMALINLFFIRDTPKTPAGPTGRKKKGLGLIESLKMLFSHRNYITMCFADLFTSGPLYVVFASISRVTPPSVSDYASTVGAIAVVMGIPAAIVVAKCLSKKKKYYEFCLSGYVLGFTAFLGASICLSIGTDIADYIFLLFFMGSISILAVFLVSAFELKTEYVYDHEVALHGHVVALDKLLGAVSNVVFVFSFPPERFEGGFISGREFTFYICSISVLIPVLLMTFMKDKRLYLRQIYEAKMVRA